LVISGYTESKCLDRILKLFLTCWNLLEGCELLSHRWSRFSELMILMLIDDDRNPKYCSCVKTFEEDDNNDDYYLIG
jgi:hypothetical protein